MVIQIIINERWVRINTIIDWVRSEYMISDHGRVYNSKTDKILSTHNENSRYDNVSLYGYNGEHKPMNIHMLVALAFIGPKPGDNYQVDHKNTFTKNNHYTNLEWVTIAENHRRAFDKGLRDHQFGENHHFNKYSDECVHNICKLLEKGIKPRHIISKLFGDNITHTEKQRLARFIKHIKRREQRVSISSMYKF